MKKSCLLDQTLQLPPIGTRVAIHDDEQAVRGSVLVGGPDAPRWPHPGTVCGHGQTTVAGSMVLLDTPLVPVVLVALDEGVLLSTNANAQKCHVTVVAVHPDNLLCDSHGRWVEPVTNTIGNPASDDEWAEYGRKIMES